MIRSVSSPARRARHREQRESTRREILAAADRFLRERPYRELSVEVVMGETGLTRTAFYRHFDDVTDLVLRLLTDLGSELFAIAERWGTDAGSSYPAPALEGLRGTVEFFAANGPLVRAIKEAAATDEQIEGAYRGALEAFIEITAGTLDRLVEAGQLQVPDTGALARALNLMNEAYLVDEFGRGEGDPQVAFETLRAVWLGAVGPLTGGGQLALSNATEMGTGGGR
jgi:TetR/AcrR family transcriptional regulator, ethionamide resistance regulator